MSNDHMVATSDLFVGDPGYGRCAYRAGSLVPAHLVELNGWKDQVVGQGTKAAKQAQGDTADATGAATPTTGEKGK